MHASEEIRKFIKRKEALRLEAYRDTGGVWTIGWGHTGKDVYEGLVIDQNQAEDFFGKDIYMAEQVVKRNIHVFLTQNQFDALVSFAYNIGAGQFAESTLCRLLNEHRYDEVPDQLMRWVYSGDKVQPGLVSRRTAECEVWLRG